MTTTGQKLVALSGLPTGTAAEHMLAARNSGLTAGAMLVSISNLTTATALQHLQAATGGGPVTSTIEWRKPHRIRRDTKWRKSYYRLG